MVEYLHRQLFTFPLKYKQRLHLPLRLLKYKRLNPLTISSQIIKPNKNTLTAQVIHIIMKPPYYLDFQSHQQHIPKSP
jgi:hypothetical protein